MRQDCEFTLSRHVASSYAGEHGARACVRQTGQVSAEERRQKSGGDKRQIDQGGMHGEISSG